MIPNTGIPPASDETKGAALQKRLVAYSIIGSSRFAGTGDFDSVPPNRMGYDVRNPRFRRATLFVPGRCVQNENG